MKKTLLSLALACLLAASLVVPAFAAFSDVPPGAWYADDVNDVQKYGVIVGVGDNRFDPNGTLTLAQAVTMAVRVDAGGDRNVPGAGNADPWYRPYADYAAKNGICGAGEFGDYNAPCSRLTMATLFFRVFPGNTEKVLNDVTSLPDLEDNEQNAPVFFLYRQGVLTGNDGMGTFAPSRSITRAETAAILNRVLDASKRKTFVLDLAFLGQELLREKIANGRVWEATSSRDGDQEYKAAFSFLSDGTVYGTFFVEMSGDIIRCRGTWTLNGDALTLDIQWDFGSDASYDYQARLSGGTLTLTQTGASGLELRQQKGTVLSFRTESTYERPWGTTARSMKDYVNSTWGVDLGL